MSVGLPVGLSVVGAAEGKSVGDPEGNSVSPGCVGTVVCGAGVGSSVGEVDGLEVGAWNNVMGSVWSGLVHERPLSRECIC